MHKDLVILSRVCKYQHYTESHRAESSLQVNLPQQRCR